jgi:hypothetical protein
MRILMLVLPQCAAVRTCIRLLKAFLVICPNVQNTRLR